MMTVGKSRSTCIDASLASKPVLLQTRCMGRYRKIKLVFGIPLMATFFLPLSRCYYVKLSVDRPQPTIFEDAATGAPRDYEDIYAYQKFQVGKFQSWAVLVAFAWPILLAALWVVGPRVSRALLPVEPLACVGSGIVLTSLLDADRILWGGYLAMFALLGYFVVSVAQFYRHIREQYFAATRGHL